MIDYDGTIIQYVDESKRAWHAGKSFWGGITDMNAHSIGIELVNPGHTNGYKPFPAAQMDALRQLAKEIMKRHNIPAHNVIGHSDVAPDRKSDPGELFPWELMAKHGIGVWPGDLSKEDMRMGDDYKADPQSLREAFSKVGYDAHLDLETLTTAFQRHFYPERFKTPQSVGQPTRTMAARLHWLVRNRPQR